MNEIVTKLLASTAAVALAAFGPATLAPAAFAQSPQGASVAAGSIAVTRQGATTVITQGTDKGIIDWRSFSIGAQEAVRFDQPGRSSVTLNRVTGVETSRIDGSLSATGQVWLSNPNGVLIGPSGQINVGGLLATTGRIDATEFLRSGRAAIDQIAKDAAIVNAGTINITEGGYAALAAAAIRNEGVIAARTGSVALGAGKAVTVDFAGDKLITFQVTEPLTQAPASGDALIANGGTIAAQGGVVLMSARAAKGVMDSVVNLKGHVVANTVRVDGGTVSFGDGGIVQVSGKIDASDAKGQGGAVFVLGEKVGLMDGASIDASGATGGGTVLVGGEWQGGGTLGVQGRNAQIAYVAPTASINVDATKTGNGGEAVVWADDTARFNGSISARGGALSGDGGRVETSGKRVLDVGPSASVVAAARAPNAKPGSWLLDPSDITIASTGGGALSGGIFNPGGASGTISTATIAAGLGSNVTISTAGGSGGSGDITLDATATLTYGGSTSTLSLLADRDIIFANTSTISFTSANSILLNARANGGAAGSIITGTSTLISTAGGSISLVGGTSGAGAATGGGTNASGVALQGVINSNGGNIVIRGQGGANGLGVTLSGSTASITGGVGTVSITGTGGSSGGASLYGVSVSGGANVSTTNGAIVVSGTAVSASNSADGVNVDGSTINASGTGAVSLTGVRGAGTTSRNILLMNSATVQTNSGSLTLTGTSSAGGAGFSNAGVRVDSSSLVTTATGAISISGTGAAVNNGSESGIEVLNGGKVTATGSTGSITMTGVRGPGSSSSSNVFVGSAGATTISTIGGNITINASAAADNVGIDNAGFNMTGGARITTTDGTISITGAVGGDGTGAAQPGVSVIGGSIIDATGTGAVTLTGVRGPAAGSQNILISGSGSKIATNSGALTLTGTATAGGATSFNHGVELAGATLSTAGGAIVVSGTGGTTGTFNHGVLTSGTSQILATAAVGNITLTGTASAASSAALSFNGATLSTVNSPLIIEGNSISTTGSTFTTGTGGRTVLRPTTTTRNISLNTVGNATTLGLLNVTSSVSGLLQVGRLDLTGSISIAGNYVLPTDLNLVTGGGAIILGGTVDSNPARSLTLDSGGGNITFADAIGGANPLNILRVNAGTTFLGGSVTTGVASTGSISFAGRVILTNSATLTTNDAPIFVAQVDPQNNGVQALAFAAGTAAVTLNVGSNFGLGGFGAAFSTITSSGSGGIINNLGGGRLQSTGTQSYAGPFLQVGTSLTLFTNNADVTFGGPVNASTSGGAVVNATNMGTGTLSLVGGLGGTTQLSNLFMGNVAASGSLRSLGSVQISSLNVLGNLTVNATSGLSVSGMIHSSANTNTLSISMSAASTISGSIGAATPLASLTTSGGQSLTLGGAVTTTGTQSYASNLFVSTASTLATTDSDITITGALNGSSGGQAFSRTVGTGTISLTGGSGGINPLTGLNFATTPVVLAGNFITAGNLTLGTATLAGATTLATSGGNLFISGDVSGAQALTVNTGTGSATVNNTLGSGVSLTSFNSLGTGVLTVGGAIRTTGTQSYTGAVVISGSTAFQTSNADITFSSTLNGTSDGGQFPNFTTGSGRVSLVGDVGTTTALASLTAPNAVLYGTVITTGTQSYSGTTSFAGSTVLSSTNGSVSFGGPVRANSTSNSLSIILSAAGAAPVFGGSVGLTTRPASLSFTTNGANVLVPVTTTTNLTVTNSGPGGFITLSALDATGSVNLTTAGAINSTSPFTANTVSVASVGGSISNATVNGQTGLTAANLVTVTSGSITINTFLRSSGSTPSTPSVPSTPTTASVPTVAPTPTTATIVSIPSIATIASVATIAPTTATIVSVASVFSIPTTPSAPSVSAPVFSPVSDSVIRGIQAQIIPLIPSFNVDLTLLAPPPPSGQPGVVSAADAFRSVSNTPAGAFIPLTPPSVQATGAPLASGQTIKIDPADTGGANGQVIAGVASSGGSTTIVPGLLTERRGGPARADTGGEPPLAQQPSEMNEEPMLD